MPSRSPEPLAQRLQESWHDNAAAWTAAVRSGAIESRRIATDAAILDAVLELRPQKTLDLGCGEGWLVRQLAEQGLAAVGVDGSAPLIEAASGSGGSFFCLSYAELIAEPARCGNNFDLVVANFALLEERILPLLTALRRIMTPDGWLLVQTLHPLAAGPPYEDGWRTEDFCDFGEGAWTPMPWYFRTLGSWVGVLRQAGFALHGLREPVHPHNGSPLSLLLEAARDDEGWDQPAQESVMSRLPELRYEDMTAEQQRIHDDIAAGPRGRVEGPLKVWLHAPKLATHAQKLGAHARFHSSLPPALSELAILVTAATWRSEFEWYAHARLGREAGIADAVIEAIRKGDEPELPDDRARAVYAVASELHRTRALCDATYASAEAVLGREALVDLVGILGYYTLVSMTLNAFRVPTPDGSHPFEDT